MEAQVPSQVVPRPVKTSADQCQGGGETPSVWYTWELAGPSLQVAISLLVLLSVCPQPHPSYVWTQTQTNTWVHSEAQLPTPRLSVLDLALRRPDPTSIKDLLLWLLGVLAGGLQLSGPLGFAWAAESYHFTFP